MLPALVLGTVSVVVGLTAGMLLLVMDESMMVGAAGAYLAVL